MVSIDQPRPALFRWNLFHGFAGDGSRFWLPLWDVDDEPTKAFEREGREITWRSRVDTATACSAARPATMAPSAACPAACAAISAFSAAFSAA